MRLEFGGRTIVAKDTLSMVKLAEKIDEMSSDVIGYGRCLEPSDLRILRSEALDYCVLAKGFNNTVTP